MQEVVDGGAQVWLAVPAELVVVALALAFAAAVKDQHPVAVADQQSLTALDAENGAPARWNLGVNGEMDALAVEGSELYAGGTFTRIAGQTRNRLGAIDLQRASLTSWNPSANNAVTALASAGSSIYVAGSFTRVGGTRRDYLAALHPRYRRRNCVGRAYQ